MFVINAKVRNLTGKVEVLRKAGELPAVYYGAGKKSTSISISNTEFQKIWHFSSKDKLFERSGR